MTSPLATDTLKQFRIIIGAVRHHFRALEVSSGVTGAQVWILSAIGDSPGIKVSLLSEMLSIHISTASNILDKLDKAGLVERRRSEKDRRVVSLYLTKAGEIALSRAPRPLTGLIPHALSQLDEDTLTRLHQDLDSLIRQMGLIDPEIGNRPLSALVS